MLNVEFMTFRMIGKRTTIFHMPKLNALELCFSDRWIVIFQAKEKKIEKMGKGTKTKKEKKIKREIFFAFGYALPFTIGLAIDYRVGVTNIKFKNTSSVFSSREVSYLRTSIYLYLQIRSIF